MPPQQPTYNAANSGGYYGAPKSRLRRLAPLLIAAGMLLVLFVGWKVIAGSDRAKGFGYAQDQLILSDTTFTFQFDQAAKRTTIDNTDYLEGKDLNGKDGTLVTAGKSTVSNQCGSVKNYKEQFKLKAQGADYSVCVARNYSYVMVFKQGNTWYFIGVVSKDKTKLPDEKTARKIMSSVAVK